MANFVLMDVGVRLTASKKPFGKKHYCWKGGRYKTTKGYIEIYKPEHPRARGGRYVAEHRLVMEKHLGRYLEPYEKVHHINGVKTDNRIENLEVWTTRHLEGIRKGDFELDCPHCHKKITYENLGG